jgi:hypothetical protein
MWCVLQSGFMKFIQIQRNYIKRNWIDTVHAITNVVFHRPSQTQHWWCDLNLYMPNPLLHNKYEKSCAQQQTYTVRLWGLNLAQCARSLIKKHWRTATNNPNRQQNCVVIGQKRKINLQQFRPQKKHKMVSWSATNRSCIDHQQKWSIRVKKTNDNFRQTKSPGSQVEQVKRRSIYLLNR